MGKTERNDDDDDDDNDDDDDDDDDDDNDYDDDHDQPVKALDALVGLVVELAVHRLVVLVHHLERVRAISD